MVITSGDLVACDPAELQAYLLAAPEVNERDVDATTVGKPVNGSGWSVFLQLTNAGSRAYFDVTAAAFEDGKPRAIAIVLDGVVVSAPTVHSDGITGGLVQVGGLSKHQAKRFANALNPS
jgi:preprotein translocase subunit SecD